MLVDPSSVAGGALGPTTGDIAVMVGGVVFPDPGWNDFVVVILDAWALALPRLLRGESQSERVHFMEGPYAVDISRIDASSIRLCAIEGRDRQVACAEGATVGFAESVVSASQDVLRACRDGGAWTRDAEQLDRALSDLRGELWRATR